LNIDNVISQLRAYAPLFVGNVAGAAGYANGVQDAVWLPLPAAYVIPLNEDADENDELAGLQQIVHERVGVIVMLETLAAGGAFNITDRRGQAAAASLRGVRSAIFAAILNWHPDRVIGTQAAVGVPGTPTTDIEGRGLYYVGGDYPRDGAFDRSRFFYQFTFGLDVTITDGDGFQISGYPMTDVTASLAVQGGSADDPPVIDVELLPQS
jgi:hypothetical protein